MKNRSYYQVTIILAKLTPKRKKSKAILKKVEKKEIKIIKSK
jgi:hypothetical protein